MKLFKMNAGVRLLALIALFSACKPTDETPADNYANGVFITNEGPFQNGTGTVDFYNRAVGGIQNDIFAKANNGAAIGNILQSMSFKNDTAFLVVNNANKLVLVNYKTFQSASTVTGFNYPRNFLSINNTSAYVTDWGTDGLTGSVKVFDYATKTVAKTVPTGKGADKMLRIGSRIWVLNSGGFGKDSTIAIVETANDSVSSKIQVGLGPNSIVQDANGDVWVLCGSYFDKSDNGKLIKIRNEKVEYSFDVPKYASSLTKDATGNTLYYVATNKIYKKDILNFGATPPSVFITQPYLSNPYSLGFDPKSGYLYCGDAKNFSVASSVYIFDPSSKILKDSVKAGIGVNGFYFF